MKYKNKQLYLTLSIISASSLVGSFGFPLQRLEVWRQNELSAFRVPVQKTFILTEHDRDLPWSFDRSKARKVGQIHHPATLQKILLLTTAVGCSVGALLIVKESLSIWENESALNALEAAGIRELQEKAKKHEFAMRQKLQHQIFQDEIREMMNSFGATELDDLEVDEVLLEQDEFGTEGTTEHSVVETAKDDSLTFRTQFPENMDDSSWKVIVKALGQGSTKDEIISQTLGGGTAAQSYFDYLKGKYL